jgi:putative membrane protein
MAKVSPRWWQDSLKGLLIGLGMLAPGLSGGVFAVALGVYPRLIEGMTTIWKRPLAVIKDLFWIAVGGLIGLFMTFFIILALIEFAPLPFTLLFLGFIIGSIPHIVKKQKSKTHWKSHLLITLTMAALIFSLPFLPQQDHAMDVMNGQTIAILIMVGFILAGTLIIPGISGSLVLLVLGFYVYLFDTARLLIERIFAFDVGLIIEASVPLILVGIGLVIGVIIFAFFLNWLLKKYQTYLYSGVLGLLLASPFSIIVEAGETYPNVWDGLLWTIPLGIVLFGLGLYGGFILQEKD